MRGADATNPRKIGTSQRKKATLLYSVSPAQAIPTQVTQPALRQAAAHETALPSLS
jgi:hypothetical protein